MRRAPRHTASWVLLASTLVCGCSYQASTTVAPTSRAVAQDTQSIALTVVVLTRGSESPVPGAAVRKDGQVIGKTSLDGSLQTTVPMGTEFHIVVDAPGFFGDGAWGSVASAERWTFYLERQP